MKQAPKKAKHMNSPMPKSKRTRVHRPRRALGVRGINEFGFKKINAENWLKPDGVIQYLRGMRCMEGYVKVVLAPRLLKKVPQDVRALFDVARGALLYGYLFYPLYTLAAGQLFRVGEAAIAHKCLQLRAPKGKKRFEDRIDWLKQRGVLSQEEGDHWHTLRRLRNSDSHATRQSILPPDTALGILAGVARDSNALFRKGAGKTEGVRHQEGPPGSALKR